MIIATAGHVDHGKTSLVKQLTGTDTDRLEEEKKRGLTINLGFAYQDIGDQVLGFVDVPGHIDFINNMLAGVASVDFALLVIAADDGIMPQTREHLSILNLLGIQKGAIALTKIDLVSSERVEKVKNDIHTLMQASPLANSPIFPVSNVSGLGLGELQSHLQEMVLDDVNTVGDIKEGYCRFSIDRSFVLKGVGTVVTGTIVSGKLKLGDSLFHSRTHQAVRVRGLRVDQKEVDSAGAGQRVAVNIKVNHQSVHRGDWLLNQAILNPVTDFDAELTFVDGDDRFLKHNGDVHFFHNASHCLAQVRKLHFYQNNDSKKMWVQIKTRQSIFGLYGDRFILRDSAGKRTIGGGTLVDIKPPARRRHAPERFQYLKRLHQQDQLAIESSLKENHGDIQLKDFSQARNLSEKSLSCLIQPLLVKNEELLEFFNGKWTKSINPQGVLLGDTEISAGTLLGLGSFLSLSQSLIEKIQSYHNEYAERQGLAPLELKRLSQFTGSYAFFQRILHKLLDIKVLAKTGTLVHWPQHKAQDKPEDLAFLKRLEPLLLEDQLTAPRTRELCEALDIDLEALDQHLHRLCLSGKLAQVAANRYYLPQSLLLHAEIVERLVAAADDKLFTVIQYRDESKVGRNLCIQILEFFDRQGFTLRRGNKRMVQKPKESLFGPFS